MKTEIIVKEKFCVIGKEGSTELGEGFVAKLWEDANSHFGEVAPLAKLRPDGSLAGCWGAMSDLSRSFKPWEDGFSKGLYLAGIECPDDAEAPEGWVKWEIPGFKYVRVKCGDADTFANALAYLAQSGLALAGAVHDFTDPASGENFMLFPIEKL